MTRFQTGNAKPPRSGRKRGTPNKQTLELHEALAANGLDLVGQLAELLPRLHEEKRADVLLELMSYVYPRRKSVEVSGLNESAASEPRVILTMPKKMVVPARIGHFFSSHPAPRKRSLPSAA